MAKSAFSKGRVYERNLEECFQEYYDEKRALNKSQATLYGYEEAINLWLNYLRHGNYSLAAKGVDVGYVLSYSHYNLNEGMKPTTLNHYLRVCFCCAPFVAKAKHLYLCALPRLR